MPTIRDPSDRESILVRLKGLTPDRVPVWGKLTAPRLLCHLSDQLRVALGEIPVRRTDHLATRTLLKWLVLYAPIKPPPGKVMTPPEMLTTQPASWETDLRNCEELINRAGRSDLTTVHP